jgi:hypothetical protein
LDRIAGTFSGSLAIFRLARSQIGILASYSDSLSEYPLFTRPSLEQNVGFRRIPAWKRTVAKPPDSAVQMAKPQCPSWSGPADFGGIGADRR